jgi:hypothetical protein
MPSVLLCPLADCQLPPDNCQVFLIEMNTIRKLYFAYGQIALINMGSDLTPSTAFLAFLALPRGDAPRITADHTD